MSCAAASRCDLDRAESKLLAVSLSVASFTGPSRRRDIALGMKRGTPDERRWENGLRQGARTSDVSEPIKSPVRGSMKLRRPQTETRTRSESRITPTPLVVTAALQAYLSNDVDARSRIPGPRSGAGPGGMESGRSKPEPRTKRAEVTRHEHEKPTETRIPIDTASNATTALSGDGASQPESPLSRFQKHMKQLGANHDKTQHSLTTSHRSPHTSRKGASVHPVTAGPSQSLARSLIDKIQEAKRLRHAEAEHDQHTRKHPDRGIQSSVTYTLPGRHHVSPVAQVQSTSSSLAIHMMPSPRKTSRGASPSPLPKPIAASTSSPPVPHAKPVMPVIPISPSTPPAVKIPGQDQQEGDMKVKLVAEKVPSSVSTVIEVMNAVLLIQRMWRRRRLIVRFRRRNQHHSGEINEPKVTLVVDKMEAVTPLFPTVSMKSPEVLQPPLRETQLSHPNEQCDTTVHALGSVNEGGAAATHERYSDEIASSHISHPWTDHELVFLEEGRRIGDLQDSVRKGFSLDEDELIWKRPEQIIQRIEAERITTLRDARRKRPTGRQLEYPAPHEVAVLGNNVSETMSPTVHSPRNVPPRSRRKDAATTARKRKMARVSLWKRRSRNNAALVFPARKTSQTREFFARARTKCRRRKESKAASSSSPTEDKADSAAQMLDDRSESQSDCGVRSPRQAGSTSSAIDELKQPADHNLAGSEARSSPALLDRFVVFSDFGEASSTVDSALSRNDLISVGDLALARSLLYDRHHGQTASHLNGYSDGFIPLTLPTFSPQAAEPSKQSLEDWDEPSIEYSKQAVTGCSEGYEPENQVEDNDNAVVDDDTTNRNQDGAAQPFDQFDAEPDALVHQRESLGAWLSNRDDGISLASLSSSTNSACSEDQAAEDTGSRHSGPADPMRALQVVKSAVTKTMARVRDEQHAACQQQQEESETPTSPPPAPAPTAASNRTPRLDEAKRLEFLRALEDFKRCLRPTSSPSSLLSEA